MFCAPLAAANFLNRAMQYANAPLDGSAGAPLMAATFCTRAMCDANAPPLGVFVASLALAFTHLDDVRTSFCSDLLHTIHKTYYSVPDSNVLKDLKGVWSGLVRSGLVVRTY